MPSDYSSIVIGVGSSFAASVLFLISLRLLRPKIVVASEISQTTLGSDPVFSIKVINAGWRDAVNLRAELFLIVPEVVGGGEILRAGQIPLLSDSLFTLTRYRKDDPSLSYAFRFTTKSNLDILWPSDGKSYLRFVIFAQDSLSSFPKIFTKEFRSKHRDLLKGDFDRGLSTDITYKREKGNQW